MVTEERIPLLMEKTQMSHLHALLTRKGTYIRSLMRDPKYAPSTSRTHQIGENAREEEGLSVSSRHFLSEQPQKGKWPVWLRVRTTLFLYQRLSSLLICPFVNRWSSRAEAQTYDGARQILTGSWLRPWWAQMSAIWRIGWREVSLKVSSLTWGA